MFIHCRGSVQKVVILLRCVAVNICYVLGGKKIYMASNSGHKLSEQSDAKVFLTNFTEAKTRLCSFWGSGRGVVTTVVCYFKIESIS